MDDPVAIDDFDIGGFDPSKALLEAQASLTKFMEYDYPNMTESMIHTLVDFLYDKGHITSTESEFIYGEDFDLAKEMGSIIQTSKAMRNQLIGPGGRVKTGVSSKEVREYLTAMNTLTGNLIKNHEKVMSIERSRALESAVIQCLQEVGGEDVVTRFNSLMEAHLQS